MLQDYWKTGAARIISEEQLGDPAFQKAHPWSAAFISWVMKTAGAGNAFKYSPPTRPIRARRKTIDSPTTTIPSRRIGSPNSRRRSAISFARAGRAAARPTRNQARHEDPLRYRDRGPTGSIVTVGGNVNNSVAQKTLRTDAGGRIAEPNYFAVIRIDGAAAFRSRRSFADAVTPSAGSAPRLIRQESTRSGQRFTSKST